MIEKTGAIEKLRYELESSVDINIDSINGLYEIIDVLIDQIQILQKDVKLLADIFISKIDYNNKHNNETNSGINNKFYI